MKAAQEEADRTGSIIEYEGYKKGGSTSKRKKKKNNKK